MNDEHVLWLLDQARIDPPEGAQEDAHGDECQCRECDPDYWRDLEYDRRGEIHD